MTSHQRNEGLTQEDYEKKYNAAEAISLVFGEQGEKKVYCVLDSLDGIVEIACGKDKLEAKENYLLHIEGLIHELQEKKTKIMYDLVKLDYTNVGEM